MSHKRIWTYMIVASTLLMGVSGSLFVSFQHWMVNESPNAISMLETLVPNTSTPIKTSTSQIVETSQHHRIMLSTAWDKRGEPLQQNPDVTTGVKTNVTTNVATRVSSMPSVTKISYQNNVRQNESIVSHNDFEIRPVVLTNESVSNAYVQKRHNRSVPSFVVYQDEVVMEFPKDIATSQNIKKAVTRLLLSRHLVQASNLLSNNSLDYKHRPYFYRKVLDENKLPIRYPRQAYDYANYLIANSAEEISDEDGDFIEVHIPLHESGLKGPAKTYQAWVNDYANQFDVNPALVYAVMETESGFNPKAVSSSNAIGLMQLKPDTAGKDVYQYVDLKPGQPTKRDLFDSEKNIRMGVAYLSLLKHDYLSDIHNDKIKQMVTISSYNGGIKTVLGLFGDTPDKAIARLNRLNPNQVYRTLRYQHQSDETRRYLDKVLKAESRYKALLDDA